MISTREFVYKHRNKLAILAIVILTCLAYAGSLKNSFVFDDYLVIVDNNFIKSWHNLPRIFNKNYLTSPEDTYLLKSQDIGSGESTYRPVATISYFIDYRLWGLKAFGYHLTNLFLHIFNVLLFYYFVFLIAKNRKVALLACLLFALHPVNTEVVYVISHRKDLLAFLFFILSLILYVRMDVSAGRNKYIAYVLSVISFSLALFSKEMAITLPLVLMLYDYYFSVRINNKKFISDFKFRYSGYWGVSLLYLFLSQFVMGSKYPHLEYPGGSFYTNILTMVVAIAGYIKWIFIPSNIHFILPDPSRVYYSLNTTVIASILLLAIFLFFGFRSRKKSKVLSFSIFWFFLTLLPVYNIIPLASPAALRYLYIPIAGFCLLEAALLIKLFTLSLSWVGSRIMKMVVGFAILAILSSYLMIIRNIGSTWKDNVSMWREIAKRYPGNIKAASNLGSAFAQIGANSMAIEKFKIALHLDPNDAKVHNALGFCYENMGQKKEAIAEYRSAVNLDPDYADAYNNLCAVYIAVGNDTQAIESCKKAIEFSPRMAVAHYNLANTYVNSGRKQEALKENKEAIEIYPGYLEAYNNLAAIYADSGDVDKAISLWNKAVTINPSFAMAHFNLSVFYFRQGKYDLAIQHCDKLIALEEQVDPEFLKMLKPYRKIK